MRSALICVFFALIAQNSRASSEDDFKPTPIPLKEWRIEQQDMAGTLQEIIKTETPPTIAAVPAHYWEDALRHSVYLTLVRDKIDQLIAKGVVITPNNKPSNEQPQEIDDHDLWEKIKSAPFDRLEEEPLPIGDVSILAKGKLVEEDGGFRFAEDDASQNKCGENNCTKAVKAFWSVKRVRQRDAEPSTGKYHYELTFSVSSQTPQKIKKRFESPVRTFTIRENEPTNPPPLYRHYDSFPRQPPRPQRAIWFHKNIASLNNQHIHHHHPTGLDRIFTSLFSDEDHYEEPPNRYKQTYVPQIYPQYSKVGYVGNRDPYHQKKILSLPHKSSPPIYRHSRPTTPPYLPPPFMQLPYSDMDPLVSGPISPPHIGNKIPNLIKTTKPAVLPTPYTPHSLQKASTIAVSAITLMNATELSTKAPEVISSYKMYKPKQPATKISYSPEHVRPPIYSAPPGVFVTMDKKPFKPMPPLKPVHKSKPTKNLPQDFRPSPQILDNESSDPDSAVDTEFRPITTHSNEDFYNKNTILNNSMKSNKDFRKPSPSKRPAKTPDKTIFQQVTTITPEIITAQNNDVNDDIEWATILGAFSKTTPMASQKEKTFTTESSAEITTTSVPVKTSYTDSKETEIDYKTTTPIPTKTTPIPKKRTRPPPKFKQQKIIKRKRITTTTTPMSTILPKKFTDSKPKVDLIPQASSAPTSGANSVWDAKNKTITMYTKDTLSTTTAYTKNTLSTTRPTTTTTYLTTSSSTPKIMGETKPTDSMAQLRRNNRFRQSMLMQKGTSVNHDKWLSPTLEKNRTISTSSEKFFPRRKVSQFHGYVSSTTPKIMDSVRNNENDDSHVPDSDIKVTGTESSSEHNTSSNITASSQSNIDIKQVNNDNEPGTTQNQIENEERIDEDNDMESNEYEFKDNIEFIFKNSATLENKSTGSPLAIEETTITTEHVATKNKTKCKKKKHTNLSVTQKIPKVSIEVFDTTMTSTEKVTTPDILGELFGRFTLDDQDIDEPNLNTSTTTIDAKGSESINRERYIGEDSVEHFLESLEVKENHESEIDEQFEEEYNERSNISHEDSPFNNNEDDEENSKEANYDDYYNDDDDSQGSRPYSILELMAME